jgi:hypothetical protein
VHNYRRGGGHWGGWPWVVFGLIAIGVVLVGLLVLAFVSGLGGVWPAGRGMMGGRGGFCPWCGRGGWGAGGLLGTLLLCGTPIVILGLIAVAVLAWTRRGELPHGPRGGYDRCANCGEPVRSDWSTCPYCGEPQEGA